MFEINDPPAFESLYNLISFYAIICLLRRLKAIVRFKGETNVIITSFIAETVQRI